MLEVHWTLDTGHLTLDGYASHFCHQLTFFLADDTVNFVSAKSLALAQHGHDKMSTLRETNTFSFSTPDSVVYLMNADFETREDGRSRVVMLDKLLEQAQSLGELLSQQKHLRNIIAGAVWDEKYHEKRLRKENRVRSPADLREMKIFLKHIQSSRKHLQAEHQDLTNRISILQKSMKETRRSMFRIN